MTTAAPVAIRRYPTARRDMLRDAALIQAALRQAEPGSSREAFILRLRKSFRTWGSLTTAMRAALRVRQGR
jgi:hypothetical protein